MIVMPIFNIFRMHVLNFYCGVNKVENIHHVFRPCLQLPYYLFAVIIYHYCASITYEFIQSMSESDIQFACGKLNEHDNTSRM